MATMRTLPPSLCPSLLRTTPPPTWTRPSWAPLRGSCTRGSAGGRTPSSHRSTGQSESRKKGDNLDAVALDVATAAAVGVLLLLLLLLLLLMLLLLNSMGKWRFFFSFPSLNVSPLPPPRLHCRYTTGRHPWLLLAPHKEETVHLKPRIKIYHDVLSDKDIDVIKSIATPRVRKTFIMLFFLKKIMN